MNFELAPSNQSKSAKKLLDILDTLETATNPMEDVALATIAGFLNHERVGVGWIFRPLIGAAAAIVREAPKHSEECECNTCFLRWALGQALEESAPVVEKKEKAINDWRLYTGLFRPANHKGMNPHLEAIERQAIPEEIERIAKEHAQVLAGGGAY